MSTKEKTTQKNKNQESKINTLILHNDNFNTFDFVIDALVDICNHEENQAHQCAVITHYKGKCEIKNGTYHELKILKDKFINIGLSVTVD